jgi:hypothetical protein
MTHPFAEHLLDDEAVLARRTPLADRPLSAFEVAVVELVDGQRDNGAVASALGIGPGDLRIALMGLVTGGWLEAHAVRPRLVQQPAHAPASTVTTTWAPPPTTAPGRDEPGHDDHHGAANLHTLAVRELRMGHFKHARQLAEQAAATAPGVSQHADTLTGWDALVGQHLGASLPTPTARVDAARVCVAATPGSPWARGRLAEVLVERGTADDIVEAAAAAAAATALDPAITILATRAKTLGVDARRAVRRQKIRAFLTFTPSDGAGKPGKKPAKTGKTR